MLLISLAIVAALAMAILIYNRQGKQKMGLPPGPRGLPILGNVFQLLQLFRDPNEVSRLTKIYGAIFTLRVASMPFIIVNDRHAAHEVLIDKGSIFAARPPPSGGARILSNGGRSINTASGSHWRWIRRNLVAGTLSSSKVHSFAHARRKAVDRLVLDLSTSADRGGVEVRKYLRFAVFSIISFMCFGEWLEDSEVSILESLMRETMRLAAGSLAAGSLAAGKSATTMVVQSFASRWIAAPYVEYAIRRRKFITPFIERAREMAALGKLDSRCYISTLFEIQKQEQGLSDEDLLVLVSEFLNVGSDSTAVTLEWALACLVNHPDVLQKLFQEIEAQSKTDGTTKQDPEGVAYLDAVIKETLRTHPPGFFTLPHAATQPCKFGNYEIPANSVLFISIYSMANDPEVWERPSEFMPERFLGTNWKQQTTSGAVNYAPFGAGRRICPGLSLAELHLEFILGRLIHEFKWSSVDGKQVDMSPLFEFTILMKTPLTAIIKPRA